MTIRLTDAEKGFAGTGPGSPPAFVAMCHLYFDSMDAFPTAFMQHVATLQSDIPNYTDI